MRHINLACCKHSIFKLKKSLKYKSTEAAEYLILKFALNVRPQNSSQLKIIIVRKVVACRVES